MEEIDIARLQIQDLKDTMSKLQAENKALRERHCFKIVEHCYMCAMFEKCASVNSLVKRFNTKGKDETKTN